MRAKAVTPTGDGPSKRSVVRSFLRRKETRLGLAILAVSLVILLAISFLRPSRFNDLRLDVSTEKADYCKGVESVRVGVKLKATGSLPVGYFDTFSDKRGILLIIIAPDQSRYRGYANPGDAQFALPVILFPGQSVSQEIEVRRNLLSGVNATGDVVMLNFVAVGVYDLRTTVFASEVESPHAQFSVHPC